MPLATTRTFAQLIRPLLRVLVGCLGGGFQFGVGLFEQTFGFLGVTLHVPFVVLLRRDDLVVRVLAQALGGGKIGMPSGFDILFWLPQGEASQKQNSGARGASQ